MMTRFLVRLSLFTGLIIGYLAVLFIVNTLIIEIQKKQLKRSVNVLLAGDSHMQKSVNPMGLTNAMSIAQTAEPYIATYWKLKYLESTIDYDTLVLSFAPHNFSSFNDLKFIHKTWSNEMYKRTYLTQKFSTLNSRYFNESEYYKTFFKQMCILPRQNHFQFIGAYKNKNKSNITQAKKAIARHFFIEGNPAQFSQLQANYLDSIYLHCKETNTELVLVTSPVHSNYQTNIPDNYSTLFEKKKAIYTDKGCIVLDKSLLAYPDNYFYNTDHLNTTGAEEFTLELFKSLSSLPIKTP